MIVEKHLIGQTVIVPYMEDTDSDMNEFYLFQQQETIT